MKWDSYSQKCLVIICPKTVSVAKNIFIPLRKIKQVEKTPEEFIKDFKEVFKFYLKILERSCSFIYLATNK